MSELLICPSMMCADFNNLASTVRELDEAGTDIFHIDIMDGRFVPNFGMGLQDVQAIRASTNKLVDVHLMIEDPVNYIKLFTDLGVDIIYFHPEADLHPARTIDLIHKNGVKAGIAINPGTSIETIKSLLPIIDYVMVMTVNPGFSGQKYLSYIDEKIEDLSKLSSKYDYQIMVDGAISPERIKTLNEIGVTGFVLGTSALFGKSEGYQELIQNFKQTV